MADELKMGTDSGAPIYEVYETSDQVLPRILRDVEMCAIRVELHEDKIILQVADRQWFIDRKNGQIDAGIILQGDEDD